MLKINATNKTKVSKSFTLSVSGEVSVSLNEIWPDGDAPENPTAQDVAKAIEEQGAWSLANFFNDWSLDEYFELDVTPE